MPPVGRLADKSGPFVILFLNRMNSCPKTVDAKNLSSEVLLYSGIDFDNERSPTDVDSITPLPAANAVEPGGTSFAFCAISVYVTT